MKKTILLLLITALTLSCQSQSNPKIKVLPTATYKEAIAKGNVQIVDVRTPQEFSEGAISNAVNINFNDESFESDIQKLDKKQPVYVYCRSGARSQKAAEKMIALGFTQVIDLEGGYLSWQ